MRLGWVGTVAFQAITDRGTQLVFDLAEGQLLPKEFKEGDEIKVVNRPDHRANIAMGMNSGFYEITHVASNQTVRVVHQTSAWRFEEEPS